MSENQQPETTPEMPAEAPVERENRWAFVHDGPVPPLRQQIFWLCMVAAALVVVLTFAGLVIGRPDDHRAQLHKTAVANAMDQQAQMTLEQEQQTLGRLGVRVGGPHAVAKLLAHTVPGVKVIVGTAAAATDTKTLVVGPGSHAKRFVLYLRSQSGIVWRLDGTLKTMLAMSRAAG